MNQTESFTISNNSWRHLPKLVEERHSLSACTLGNSFIYAIGGSSAINYGSSLSTIERLNFASSHNFNGATHWEHIYLSGPCSDAKRSQLGSFAISESQIMIFGGFLDTDLTAQCFVIDTGSKEIKKMSEGAQMRKAKKFIKFKDYILKDGRSVYVVDDENEIHQFDIDRQQWHIIETSREQP